MNNPAQIPNNNSAWANLRGSWITNIVLVLLLRLGLSLLPGISNELSWTLTVLIYNMAAFIMFHGVKGIPYDFNQNELGSLTLWEQMDNGEQFTPSKKYFTAVPIILFLLSVHYTRYDLPTFALNFLSTLIVIVAKLPRDAPLKLD